MTDSILTRDTWLSILESAYLLFSDAEARGFGTPPFALGGGTVLMLEYRHRLSKDIDLFGYDAQWLSILTPRLNDTAGRLAIDYVEQANALKIVLANGDIDFIIAADVSLPVTRKRRFIAGRHIEIEPPVEILAKKLFYRAASLAARDVYDLSATIDLAPGVAAEASRAAVSKRDLLMRRLDELAFLSEAILLGGIVPYDGKLPHADRMVCKVRDFILSETDRERQAGPQGGR